MTIATVDEKTALFRDLDKPSLHATAGYIVAFPSTDSFPFIGARQADLPTIMARFRHVYRVCRLQLSKGHVIFAAPVSDIACRAALKEMVRIIPGPQKMAEGYLLVQLAVMKEYKGQLSQLETALELNERRVAA